MRKPRVLLYVRVSSHEQAAEGYSIGEQTERLQKYADAMEWTVIRVYTDPGFSGSNTERPALKELIRAVKDGLADKVVVYKLDRLSRSQKDTLYLIEDVFLKNNVDFVSISENFDTGTAFGRAMIGILAVFAQLERETIKERMFMGREARAKDGYYIGGEQIIIGYDYKNGELTINDYEAAVVRMIFDQFISSGKIEPIAKDLNARGLYRKKKWSHTTITQALKNRTYIGEVKFAGLWYQGRHEPIIERSTFDNAQEILRIRAESYTGTNKHSRALTGFIWCGKCGARYHRLQGGPKKDGTRNFYYACYSVSKKNQKQIVDPNCNNKTYPVEELEGIIFNEVRKLEVDPAYLERLKSSGASGKKKDDRRAIQAEIGALTDQISKYMDLYALNRLGLQEIDDKIAPLAEKRARLEAAIKDLEIERPVTAERAAALVESFGEILDRGDLDEIRLTLTTLISKIVIYDDDIEIYWNFT